MKLVRYGPAGKEKPGLIDADGKLRDLSRKVKDIDAAALAPAKLRELAKLDPKKLPLVKGRPRLGACVATPSKFVAIGLNFTDHAKETGSPDPRASGRVLQVADLHRRPQRQRDGPEGLDPARLGSRARHRDRQHGAPRGGEGRDASYVAGYCVGNDVSEREFQLKKGASQWSKGKGCDTFGPLGPWLVTSDEIKDPQNLGMWLDVNGERRQTGNTKTMIFGVAALVADVSQLHDAAARRRDHDRHAARRGPRHEAAGVAQGRRRDHARHRRPRRRRSRRWCRSRAARPAGGGSRSRSRETRAPRSTTSSRVPGRGSSR